MWCINVRTDTDMIIDINGERIKAAPQLKSDGTLGPPIGTYQDTLHEIQKPDPPILSYRDCLRLLRTLEKRPTVRGRLSRLLVHDIAAILEAGGRLR